MSEITKRANLPDDSKSEDAYHSIRGYVVASRRQVYSSVNAAMVAAYWNIGKSIYEICGENDRAAYGMQVLEYISEKLTAEFGKGFRGFAICDSSILPFQNAPQCGAN